MRGGERAIFSFMQGQQGPHFVTRSGMKAQCFRACTEQQTAPSAPRMAAPGQEVPFHRHRGQCMGRMAATTTTKSFIQQQGQEPPRAGIPTRDMIFLFCRPLRPAFIDRIGRKKQARGHRCRMDRIGRQHHKRNNKPAAFSF